MHIKQDSPVLSLSVQPLKPCFKVEAAGMRWAFHCKVNLRAGIREEPPKWYLSPQGQFMTGDQIRESCERLYRQTGGYCQPFVNLNRNQNSSWLYLRRRCPDVLPVSGCAAGCLP